jgi:hypothetical protein
LAYSIIWIFDNDFDGGFDGGFGDSFENSFEGSFDAIVDDGVDDELFFCSVFSIDNDLKSFITVILFD